MSGTLKPQPNVIRINNINPTLPPTFKFVVPEDVRNLGLKDEEMSALEYTFKRKRFDGYNFIINRIRNNAVITGVATSVSNIELKIPTDVTQAPTILVRDLLTGNYFVFGIGTPIDANDLRNKVENAYGRAAWTSSLISGYNHGYLTIVKYEVSAVKKRSKREYDRIAIPAWLANQTLTVLKDFFEERKQITELINDTKYHDRQKRTIRDYLNS